VIALEFFNFPFNLYVNRRKIFSTILVAFIIGILFGGILWKFSYTPTFTTEPEEPPSPISPSSFGVGCGAFTFPILPELEIKINVPQYELPVDLEKVNGYAKLKTLFGITLEQEQLLSENGFVVLRLNKFETLGEAYDYILDTSLPLLVTTDAVVHAYHVLFDETLKRAEMNELIDVMNTTIATLLSEAQIEVSTYAGTPLESAARLNRMYLEVAYSLINLGFSPTSTQATQELALITAHSGVSYSPIFEYREDYTQYVPRGHYTENERLKAYFKTMMWLGRIRFAILPDQDIDTETVRKQTRAAILLTSMMSKMNVYDDWERVYEVTKFFVGVSDDLTFQDYSTVLEETSVTNTEQLNSNDKIDEVAGALLKRNKAKILGTYAETYPWMPQEQELERILAETAGLRFMGQRFIPDSYMFQQLVYPQVGTFSNPRLFPKSLDVPAVLGSETAEEILNETEAGYMNYTVQLNKLELEFQALNVANWTRNLYWSWLYTLNTTLEPILPGYPSFMTTEAWSYEKLQTFTGSWTELRHDTILYAKQSYTPKIISVPPTPAPNTAYVEPYPQTYLRLTGLLNMTLDGLEELQLLSTDINDSLTSFRDTLKLFLNASVMELEGKDLPQNTQMEIRDAAETFTSILDVASEKTQKTMIAADVHTDLNTEKVLEETLGKFNILIIIYSDAEGNLYASAGPVYNYFEFLQPMDQRLTDEKWVEILSTDPPEPPEWTNEFAA